jgi:hypothetical protein
MKGPGDEGAGNDRGENVRTVVFFAGDQVVVEIMCEVVDNEISQLGWEAGNERV